MTMEDVAVRRYSLDVSGFPRFRYFQSRLSSVFPRFKGTVDKGKLISGTHSQEKRLGKLGDAVSKVKVTPVVTVLHPARDGEIPFSHVVVDRASLREKPVCSRYSVERLQAESEKISEDMPYAIVVDVILDRDEIEAMEFLDEWLQTLTMKLNPIQIRQVVVHIGGVSSLPATFEQSQTYRHIRDQFNVVSSKHRESLAKALELQFEAKAVRILEQISDFIQSFGSRFKAEVACSKTRFLDDIDNTLSESLHKESMQDFEIIHADRPRRDEVTTDSEGGVDVGDKTEFLKRQFSRRIVCTVSEHLASKYNLSRAFLYEWLQEADLEHKVKAELHFNTWTPYHIQVNPEGISDIVEYAEGIVVERNKFVTVLMKIKFEIAALLRMSDVRDIALSLPTYPKLSKDLQQELLRLPNVSGCGMIYGKLTVAVRKERDESTRSAVRDVLRANGFLDGFQLRKFTFCHQAGGMAPHPKPGSKLSAQITGTHNSGALGGFLLGSNTPCDTSESTLFAITCAHVVEGSEEVFFHPTGKPKVPLGRTSQMLSVLNGYKQDVAAVEVYDGISSKCDTALKNVRGKSQRSRVMNEPSKDIEKTLSGRSVYMWSDMKLKQGIITSPEFKVRQIQDAEESGIQFTDEDNIFIESEPDETEVTSKKPFSVSGDSGSFVCAEDTDDSVTAIALLLGAVQYETTKHYCCTVSTHLNRTVEALEQKSGIKFEWPPFTSGDIEFDEFDDLPDLSPEPSNCEQETAREENTTTQIDTLYLRETGNEDLAPTFVVQCSSADQAATDTQEVPDVSDESPYGFHEEDYRLTPPDTYKDLPGDEPMTDDDLFLLSE